MVTEFDFLIKNLMEPRIDIRSMNERIVLLEIVNKLFSSQYHLPLDLFLQKLGEIFPIEKSAIYYNRLNYEWQLIGSKICEWSAYSQRAKFPDIIEYQKIWPEVETKFSLKEWITLTPEEIKILFSSEDIDHKFFAFPLFDGKWWNGVWFLDWGESEPSQEELLTLKALAESLSLAIKRQKRETEYLDTSRIFQELLNNIPDIIILTDLKERWLLANKKTLEVLGFKRPIYQGRTFEEIIRIRPEFSPLFKKLQELLRKIAQKEELVQETIKIKRQGRCFWIDFLLIPFQCDAEKRILIIGRDISSIKLAQERLLSILENLPAIVYLVDPNTKKIIYHNSLFKKYFGKQLIGKSPCYKALFQRDKICNFCHIDNDLNAPPEVQEIYDSQRKRWLRMQEAFIPWLDGGFVRLSMMQDITKEKKQEENLLRTQKLEVLGRLTANIAHEFNNVLAIINGYMDLISYYTEGHEKIGNYIIRIQKAIDSGTSLIKQLLILSRKKTREEKEVEDLNEMIQEQKEVLKKLIGENIFLEFKLAKEKLPIRINFEGLQHILTNLVVNARDAMPQGGKLSITTQRVETSEKGPCALLKVSDTGEGIPPERLAQIFEPFYTTKPPGEGTGLGLTIILSIVRKAGGEIKVASQVGEGTTFEILLPLSKTKAKTKPEKQIKKKAEDLTLRPSRILIVEDEPHIREMLAEMLEGQGFAIAVAENGEEALQWLRNNHYKVDLIITDVVMPKMDGVHLYRTVQAEAQDIPFLFISGYAQQVLEKYGFDEKAFRILKKPFTFKQLLDEIKKYFKDQDKIDTPPI